MAVLEVTFNPAKWTYAGAQGAWSVFMDQDGVTAWAFEAFGQGWARFNITTGAVIAQDTFFGTADTPSWYSNWFSSSWQTFFAQGAGGYYFTSVSAVSPATGAFLHKFQVGAGTAGSFLNGYDVNSTSYDLFANIPALYRATWDPMDAVYFSKGGTNYVAFLAFGQAAAGDGFHHPTLQVINADTMTFVGIFDYPTNTMNGCSLFVDSTGVLWASYMDYNHANVGAIHLEQWDAANGATGGVLNMGTPHNLTSTDTGLTSNIANIGYIASSNSVFVANVTFPPTSHGTASVALLTLGTWARTQLIVDTGTLFHNAGEFPCSPAAAQSMNFLNASSAASAIEGAPNTTNQVGGCVNLINQTSLAVIKTANITSLINASSVTDKIALTSVPSYIGGSGGVPTQYRPFTSMSWNSTANKVVVTYGDEQAGTGSAVYIVDVPSASLKVPLPITQYVYLNDVPVANGYLLLSLNVNGQAGSEQLQDNKYKIPLDVNGTIVGTPTFWPNSLISPAGTYYVCTVYNSTGQIVAGPYKVTL